MKTEQEKLEAAYNVVSNSIFHGWTTESKINYISKVLPDHYEVNESKKKGNVHCKSSIGIEDDERWGYFMSAIKQRFADFLEVYHNLCDNHCDFTVYFGQPIQQKPPIIEQSKPNNNQ